ncbi:hypothetical protein [Paraburkholderia sp. J8-2]|uniref:hypothetical protein n=1 Tax=Paraburkholderia sp. J8-2 TaxID=2805440 RepID=UPI002AB6FF20|nr:hypothetical protein [Paraburkholderia sp. J8-2]
MNTVEKPKAKAKELSSGAHRARSGTFLLAVVVVIYCFVKVAFIEPAKARREANAAVVEHSTAAVTSALSNWSYTEPSPRSLTPDTHWSGRDARVVGVYEQDVDSTSLMGKQNKAWIVIAKTRSGRYFSVQFELCERCQVDADDVGWKRLFVHGFQPLTEEVVRDSLYRNNLLREYKAEFGTDAPPRTVEG